MPERCRAAVAVLLTFIAGPLAAGAAPETTLWYDKPATAWLEAVPVGNGRMGAMVFGGVPEERIQFNEQTLWTGASSSQAFLDAEKVDHKTHDKAMGDYQPFGNVAIVLPPGHKECTDYQRHLDLETGIARTSYRCGRRCIHTRGFRLASGASGGGAPDGGQAGPGGVPGEARGCRASAAAGGQCVGIRQ